MSREEVMEALFTIQEVCNDCDDCSNCPLSNSYGKCTINNELPNEWEINVDVWKAFKN